MQFLIKSTKKSRFMSKLEWHPWFAWYPVLISVKDNYSKKYAFGETIARKGISYNSYVMDWEYKSLEDMKNA